MGVLIQGIGLVQLGVEKPAEGGVLALPALGALPVALGQVLEVQAQAGQVEASRAAIAQHQGRQVRMRHLQILCHGMVCSRRIAARLPGE